MSTGFLKTTAIFDERPSKTTPSGSVIPRDRSESLRDRGGGPTFWRCQNPDSQPKAEYSEVMCAANIKGSVAILVTIDTSGTLMGLRVASPDADPHLSRAAVKALSQWTFTTVKWKAQSLTQFVLSCDGEGEVRVFQGTFSFDFP